MLKTYKPSGSVGPLALPCFGIALTIAVCAGWIYQYFLSVIPVFYVNIVIAIAMAFLLAFLASLFVFAGHTRNVAVAFLFSVVLCGSGIGSKFWFQYQSMVKQEVAAALDENRIIGANPDQVERRIRNELTFLKHIEKRVSEGWVIDGRPQPSGFKLIIAWLLEAGFILYVTVSAAVSTASDPYNEKLNKWADQTENLLELPVSGSKMIDQIKAATSIDQLLTVPVPESDRTAQIANYKVNRVEDHPLEDAYLSIELVTTKVNRKGDREQETETLVKFAIISAQQLEQLVENTSLMAEALEDYRKAMHGELEDVQDA